jgi:riboflavin kinase/FMN adenylyltransferase
MIHIYDKTDIQLDIEKGTVVALGKFDGIHAGHMKLVNEVLKLQKQGYTGVMFTLLIKENSVFDINKISNIYTSEEKKDIVAGLGLDVMVEYPFDDSFAHMDGETFVRKILVEMLHVKYIVVGTDYRFGYRRQGDVELLKALSEKYNYEVIAVEKEEYCNIIVSSTYIRNLISQGHMEKVTEYLGRPYSMSGCVTGGKRLGRTIGFPTANILPQQGKIYPPVGVYISRIILDDNRHMYGITNIGDNPTVNSAGNITIETYIFDFDEDIYGHNICVELLSYIRGEKKFASVDQLKTQLQQDMAVGRLYINRL